MADKPPCVVAMEACASAYHWAREQTGLGHEIRLIALHYVKPIVKRQKNDAADAEAIVEAPLRPTMRFVEPKTGKQQARATVFQASGCVASEGFACHWGAVEMVLITCHQVFIYISPKLIQLVLQL